MGRLQLGRQRHGGDLPAAQSPMVRCTCNPFALANYTNAPGGYSTQFTDPGLRRRCRFPAGAGAVRRIGEQYGHRDRHGQRRSHDRHDRRRNRPTRIRSLPPSQTNVYGSMSSGAWVRLGARHCGPEYQWRCQQRQHLGQRPQQQFRRAARLCVALGRLSEGILEQYVPVRRSRGQRRHLHHQPGTAQSPRSPRGGSIWEASTRPICSRRSSTPCTPTYTPGQDNGLSSAAITRATARSWEATRRLVTMASSTYDAGPASFPVTSPVVDR